MTTCLAESVKPFSQEIVELVVQCYNLEPHETAIELARSFFTLFGRGVRCESQPVLSTLFASLIGKTLQHVQSTGNLSDHSELISTFFRLEF